MFFSILKKDLKRKRTMNIILLLFIVISSTFISSSINNISAVFNAIDNYFEKADMPDYFTCNRPMGKDKNNNTKEILDSIECIDSYKIEPYIVFEENQITYEGEGIEVISTVITPFEQRAINFFDKDNNVITEVKQGEAYLIGSMLEDNDLSVGDIITITMEEVSIDLKIAGEMKDAFLGSRMITMSRIIINQSDFDKLCTDSTIYSYLSNMAYIKTDDIETLEEKLTNSNMIVTWMGNRETLEMTFVMDMVIAGVLLIVSVCLVLIALMVLRFTISFTLAEEFREIGVMKAIGIRNFKIRGLYLVKYLAISTIGSLVGLIIGIPFGKYLLSSVEKNMVMESDSSYLINILSAFSVVAIVMLFSYLCTRMVNKCTPIAAVSSGGNEGSKKCRGVLSLSKSRLSTILFMALNDILSNIRRYIIMIITFTIGLTIIIITVNTGNTLKSSGLIEWFGYKYSDAYISIENYTSYMKEGGRAKIQSKLEEIEKIIEAEGIPCVCAVEVAYRFNFENVENSFQSIVFQGINTSTEDYTYIKGTAPRNENEIAITPLVAKRLKVEIGDKIKLLDLGKDREFLITGLFQSMSNMGEGARLHEDLIIDLDNSISIAAWQVNYTDNPSDREIKKRMKIIEDIYGAENVFDGGEFVDYSIGGIAGTIDGVKIIIVPIILVICMLVVILMERSFISKEKGEIAILKSIGFNNSSIVKWHTLRILVVLLIATGISILISTPVSEISTGQVFKVMGAQSVEFEINALEVYVFYPMLMLVFTIAATFFTAQYTRTISAAETSNIE